MIKPEEITISDTVYKIPLATCNLCGHKWILRHIEPPCCPRCRSSQWNKVGGLSKEEVTRGIFRYLSNLSSMDIDGLVRDKERDEILIRDGERCVVCDMKEKLEVHHIDSNSENNKGCNQVALCKTCHSILGRRTYEEMKTLESAG